MMTNRISDLSSLLFSCGVKNPFLVTTRKSFDDYFVELLPSAINFTRFSDYSNNPKYEEALLGVGLLRESKCDGVIAMGGGSAIDMAKIINLLSNNIDIDQSSLFDKRKYKKSLPFFAIPTTAGSGSEATQFAVIYIDGIKHSIDDELLRPSHYILDPLVLEKIPQRIIAHSGLDALCQSIESHWSVKANAESQYFSRLAISLIWENLMEAFSGKPDAKAKMLSAAHYAGKAINITRTTAPHAISYPFTSIYGVEHGHAVSLSLLYFMQVNLHAENHQYNIKKEVVLRSINEVFEATRSIGFLDFKTKFLELTKSLGVQINLTQFNLDEEKKVAIISQVNLDRLKNNPVQISKEHLMSFLSGD